MPDISDSSNPSKDDLEALRKRLREVVERWRDRARGAVFKLKQAAADVARADELRLFGEVLKIHLAEVPRRAASVTLPNMFGGPDLSIPLDPKLAPGENMKKYFKQYQKAERGIQEVEKRLEVQERSLRRLDGLEAEIAAAPHVPALESIERRFQELGLAGRRVRMRAEVAPAEKKGPRRFVSADGFDILVGRSAEENEELSFRLARGNDWWFHVQHQAGAHVVVRMPKGKELTQESLLDAGVLAAWHSKARGKAVAEVTYTQAKNVTRPRGGSTGMAVVQRGKSVKLAIDVKRLERLLEPGKQLGEGSGDES
jgi:predicted ribosome quality control (RQC) complex YloA/Tae2 family protein